MATTAGQNFSHSMGKIFFATCSFEDDGDYSKYADDDDDDDENVDDSDDMGSDEDDEDQDDINSDEDEDDHDEDEGEENGNYSLVTSVNPYYLSS
jgi:hypothetical protein